MHTTIYLFLACKLPTHSVQYRKIDFLNISANYWGCYGADVIPTSYSSWDLPWRPIGNKQVSSPYFLLREAVSSGLATANTAFCSNTQLLFCVLRVNISNNLKICFILHFLYVYLIAKPVFYDIILWNHQFQMFDISLPHFHPLKWTVKAVHSTHYERKRKPTF